MTGTFLGISPFLSRGAPGHYERYHAELLESMKKFQNDADVVTTYFGSIKSDSLPFVQKVMSETFKNPDRPPRLKEIINLGHLIANQQSEDSFLFAHVFEGTPSLFLAINFAQIIQSNIFSVFNLHQIDSYKKLFRNPINKWFYKKYIFSNQSRFYNCISCESDMGANYFGEILSFKIQTFPMFSTFNSQKTESHISNYENLILLSGPYDEEIILKDLEIVGDMKNSILFDSRIEKDGSKEFIENLRSFGLKIIGNALSENDYVALFRGAKKVWFLYRSEVNLLGSSGRLMDAIKFGAKVYLPKNSALIETAVQHGIEVYEFHLESKQIKQIGLGLKPNLETLTSNTSSNCVAWIFNNCQSLYDSISLSQENVKFGNMRKFKAHLSISIKWLFIFISYKCSINLIRINRIIRRYLDV